MKVSVILKRLPVMRFEKNITIANFRQTDKEPYENLHNNLKNLSLFWNNDYPIKIPGVLKVQSNYPEVSMPKGN